MPAYHNLLLTARKNNEGVEFKLNQTGQLLCYVSNEFSTCAAGDRVSPLSGGSITEEHGMTIMSKGLSRTETRWGQRCALVQETNNCLIICNWRRKKEEKSGCERRWWGGWDLPGCAARFYHIPTIVFFTQSLPQAPFALYELHCYSTHHTMVMLGDYITV